MSYFVGGAVIGSSALGAISANKAGKQQAAAAGQAQVRTDEAAAQARQDVLPFAQTGAFALPFLADFVSQDPNVGLQRTAGFQDIQQSAAAGGKLQSGGTLEALTEFNQRLNLGNRAQRFNELFNVATLGANASARAGTNTLTGSQIGSEFLTQGANARAAGRIGQGNAVNQGIENLIFLKSATS
jgi:hypothetical protein